ncbi:DUF2059 domain-containing protein [Pseudomonas sp. gcc21]|uniref:DUF2059 domain-containing protein n=1 Tax=Pseudomonas sp. gcc21 TaxID=2726989 RepID=UPI001451D1DC|nr:DUF2059 domain-containing protein [Pseudomonas sp. gcc21]QJD59305.1 DUF2059 domain-containing protein [Pseudomonas sp. gcc21]
MRLTALHTLILTLLTTLVLHSFAAQAAPGSTAALYQASGMNQHQEHFQFALKAAQQRYAKQLPARIHESLVNQSNLRFAPKDMHDRALARLALTLQEEDQRQALAFYDSALGRKVVNAETRATSPASIVAMQRGFPEPALSPERRAHIDRLSELLPALDIGVEVSLSLASLAAASANSFLGGLMQIPESVVTGRRDDLRNQMQPNLPATLAHVYRDLSDDELAGLIKWSESEHGKLFYAAVELAVRDALNP